MKNQNLQFGIEVIKSLVINIIVIMISSLFYPENDIEMFQLGYKIIIVVMIIWGIFKVIKLVKKYRENEKQDIRKQERITKIKAVINFEWADILSKNPVDENKLGQQDIYQNLIEKMKDELLKEELSFISRDEANEVFENHFKNTKYNKGYTGTII